MNKPPVYIKFIKPSETELFDNTIFSPFLHSGVHLNYIVWPPVYLHEAGGLISKGIAEGKPWHRQIWALQQHKQIVIIFNWCVTSTKTHDILYAVNT